VSSILKRAALLPFAILSRWRSIAYFSAGGIQNAIRAGRIGLALKITMLAIVLSVVAIVAETCRVFDRSEAGEKYDSDLNKLNF